MLYCKVQMPHVAVSTHKDLIVAWKTHHLLAATYSVDKPLTASQHSRLPAGLRELLVREPAE